MTPSSGFVVIAREEPQTSKAEARYSCFSASRRGSTMWVANNMTTTAVITAQSLVTTAYPDRWPSGETGRRANFPDLRMMSGGKTG